MPSCRTCNLYKRESTISNFKSKLVSIPYRLFRDVPEFKVALRYGLIKID